MILSLKSPAFQTGDTIPARHSKLGGNVSPTIEISGVPDGTKSLALIMDDPDAPSGLFVHWVLYRIPAKTTNLEENMPAIGQLPDGARQGRNGFGDLGYGGPQPPSGTHRYFFHLYALDVQLNLAPGISRAELDRALDGHVIEEAQMMGRYQHAEAARSAG